MAWQVLKAGASTFSAAVTPPVWRSAQPVAIAFDSRAIGRLAVSRAYHARVGPVGGRRANFVLEGSKVSAITQQPRSMYMHMCM